MANSDHKARVRRACKPTNALGRPYWLLGLTADDVPETPPESVLHHSPAICAALNKAIHALTQILGNSAAFAALQDACETVDPGQLPLDAQLTDGLLAALYLLSEQAEEMSMELLDAALGHLGGEGVPRC